MKYRYPIAIAIIATVLLALILFSTEGGTIAGYSSDKVAYAAFLTVLVITVGARFFYSGLPGTTLSGQLGKLAKGMALWISLFVGVLAAYSFRGEIETIAQRIMGDIKPGRAFVRSPGEMVITQTNDGGFFVDAEVNGQAQSFLFDTGASTVVLTAENAKAMGFIVAPEDYTIRTRTANGTTSSAPIVLKLLTIGPITETDVPAMVAKPGSLHENLLGRSFLDRLSSYEIHGDRLILRWKGVLARSASE